MQVENGILQLMSVLAQNPAGVTQSQQSQGSSFGDLLDQRLQGAQQQEAPQKPQQDAPQKPESSSAPEAEQPQQPVEDTGKQEEAPQDGTAALWAAAVMAPAQWSLQAPQAEAPQTGEAAQAAVAVAPAEAQVLPQGAEAAQEAAAPVQQAPLQPQQATPQEAAEAPELPAEQPAAQAQQAPQAEVEAQAQGRQAPQPGQEPEQPAAGEMDLQVKEAPVETPQAVFGQVEAAPVKVSDIPQAQQAESAPDVEAQIDKGLAEALQRGDTKVEIQLNPASLGNVKIEVTRSAEGALYVVLTAEHQQTQGLLEKHAAGLQALLMGSSPAESVEVHVQRQQEGQQAQSQSYDGSSGNGREEQHQERRRQQPESADFLQQLRLGLVPAQSTAL